ncbi:MAG TPA: DUF1292 domain-containing protein [bacterium]|nr:DUF1292 domain-containing protein [bacterium]
MTERGESITLVDDQGNAHEFTLVDVIEVAAQRYAVLQPENPEEGAVVFRVEGETLLPVEDDEEFDRVVDALRELDEYDDLSVAGEEHEDDEDDDDDDEDEDGAAPDREVN